MIPQANNPTPSKIGLALDIPFRPSFFSAVCIAHAIAGGSTPYNIVMQYPPCLDNTQSKNTLVYLHKTHTHTRAYSNVCSGRERVWNSSGYEKRRTNDHSCGGETCSVSHPPFFYHS
ncbi:hypothetical protein HanXRQr2_Chr14g0662531 [Helianthus annuus]|uniref:Uncharacterized protein n=1 Tax=Helianthus annuus TaxID=4232 RepID=A0A9K3H7P2_HELAN|nr:hypothetical protein HanXRQr2_Chr14g0662531 [Helianthus annuus]KAJ0841917.1 hypothetical protein HanPSC8_Chr14g0635821 [Helianthus annuus]